MRPIRIGTVLLLMAFPASAQSLAELAKKEKERRQKLPPSKVITEEDLKKVGGGSFSVSGAEAASSARQQGEPGASANPGSAPSQKDRQAAELRARYQQRYDGQKASLARAREDLADCQAARGIYILTRATKRDCSHSEKSVRAAEEALRQTEDELMNEARKAGIPPGRVRLR